MALTIAGHVSMQADSIKGSRFYVELVPVGSDEQAAAVVVSCRERRPDASHHCSAWRLSCGIERANDDGEPHNSAGRPMLSQLAGEDLVDVVAVVTRYFGGTKLGVGGLMRAYGGSVRQAISTAELIAYRQLVAVSFEHTYPVAGAVRRCLEANSATVTERVFGSSVTVTAQVPVANRESLMSGLADLSGGSIIAACE